jgi:hypothetical protein
MKSFKLLVFAAVLVGLAGCDTTAFTEDFPDPGTEGLPPYVAFDIGTLETQQWTYTAADDALGSVRTTTTPEGTAVRNLEGLRSRLPVAIGENVVVSYTLGGTAVSGVDYNLQVFDLATNGWVDLPTGDGSFTIVYSDENPQPVQVAPHYRDVRIQILPNAASAGTQRTIQFDLASATSTSGRQMTIGRFPTNRDNRATVIID